MAHKLLLTLLLLAQFGIGTAQIVNTVAGNGIAGYSGDGGPATAAEIHGNTRGIFADSRGNFYFTDRSNNCVRKVDATGTITTIAGIAGVVRHSGDGGPATAATFMDPQSIVGDATGNLYINDRGAHCIRKIDASGIISTYAGIGTVYGYSGDGGPATAATLKSPFFLAIDPVGILYVSDWANNRVRKIDESGIITTIAGSDTVGYSGDGGPATAAKLHGPQGLAADALGNVYIADLNNHVIRKINASGIITTIAGTGVAGYGGDGGPATLALLARPQGVATDVAGNIYIADRDNHRFRKIDASGTITTILGTGIAGYSGDGGPATAAQVNVSTAIHATCAGELYCSDQVNHRIRKITFTNVPPYFRSGSGPISIASCAGLPFVLDSFLTVTDTNLGQQLTWSLLQPPAHGVAAVDNSTAATGGAITPVGLYYTPTAGYVGTDTFRVMVADCGGLSSILTFHATINPLPNAGTLSGIDTLCMGDTVALTATIPGGSWGSSNTAVATVSATGQAVGLGVGPATIRYLISNSCGTDTATHSLLVLPAGLCHTGIGIIAAAGLPHLYPNPASGVCNLYLPGAGLANITLTDITGRVVQVVETNTAYTTIPLTGLASGTYLIIARWAGGVWNGRVVVE